MSNQLTRLETAYSKLGLREPFVAAVASKVPYSIVSTDQVPTAGTNGTRTYYGESFIKDLNDEQLFGLVLHENMHVVLMHMWNRNGRNPVLWNLANDAIINRMILKMDNGRSYQLPPDGVFIDWVTEEMTSEEVYEKLRQQMQQQKQKKKGGSGKGGSQGDKDDGGGGGGDEEGDEGGGGGGGGGDPSNLPGVRGKAGFGNDHELEDAQDESTRADMQATIQAAAKAARDCGHGSALIDRVLGSLKPSVIRWQDVLRNMLTESSAADYSYQRFSRRFIGRGLCLPSLHTPAMGGLIVGFDTSGSIGADECEQIASEIRAIAADVSPAFIEVVYCDAAVTRVERFERDEDMVLHPLGGGGTRFKPVFDHADKTGERYVGMVYFTDLEGPTEECVEPDYPVLWANFGHEHNQGPFGVTAQVVFR